MGKKYNKELKLTVVKEHDRGYSIKYLADKYAVVPGTVKNWCSQYQMFGDTGIEKSMTKTKYSGEFKLAVLNYRHINKVSYTETAEQFSIKNASTIANWQRTFDTKGFEGLNASQGRPKEKGDCDMANKEHQPRNLTQSELEELIELREKNHYLEAELAYLKKLEALIQKKSITKKKPNSF